MMVFTVASVMGAYAEGGYLDHGLRQFPAHGCADDFGGLASWCLRVRERASCLALFRLEQFGPVTS